MAPGFLSLALLALSAPAEALAPDVLTDEPFVAVDCSYVSSSAPHSFHPPAHQPCPDPAPQAWLEDDLPDDPKALLARPGGPRPGPVFGKPRGAPQGVNAPPLCCSTSLIYALGTLLL